DRFARTDVGDGLVVLTESMPGLRSASIGIWVRAGSVHETPELMGASHMLEHMVFKGTTRRSARDLALVLERVGGSLDAYTTREHTCYQAKVLDENTELALDVLADLVMSPLLRPEDLELEREVVLEEIATVEDTPDDLIFDLHAEQLWGDHPYGYSILGTRGGPARGAAGRAVSHGPGQAYVRAAGPAPDRALAAVERVRWREELTAVPARPRGARTRLRRLLTAVVLPGRGRQLDLRGDPSGVGGPGGGGDPRGDGEARA